MNGGCATLCRQPIKTDDNKTIWRCETLWPFEDEKNIKIFIGSLFAVPQTIVDLKAEKWARFQGLVKQWRDERGARSSITESAMLPAYQKIIGMGQAAISLILAQLESEGDQPDQWFWALIAITGQNPVKPEDQGNFRKMAGAWIEWGKENRDAYIW